MSPMPWSDWPASRRVAATALVAALAWDVFVLVRPLPDAALVSSVAPNAVPVIRRRAFDDPLLVSAAASRSPFGGSAVVAPPATFTGQSWSAPAPAAPRLVGTVVQEGGGFVMIELPDTGLRLVRIGGRAGGLTLVSVGQGTAVFQDSAGHRVPLRSPAPGTGSPP